jgi:hypothetical protein
LQVRQEGDRATLNAAIPPGFLKKMLAESEEGAAASPGSR